MQPPRTPPTEPDGNTSLTRVQGWRATIEFAPKPTSTETICAGVVVKTEDGVVDFLCTVDAHKMEHAFGSAGVALSDVALKLCKSLAGHWTQNRKPDGWKPPFNNAKISSLDEFSGRTTGEAMALYLNRTSTLHTLLDQYEIAKQNSTRSIVERVRQAVKKDVNAKHLAPRFNKFLTVAGDAQPLKVDFLGQRFACYFLQLTRSDRGIEVNTERAFGKLYELQALSDMVKAPPATLGLLDDERPSVFELLMVGSRDDAVQRRAIYQIEALADKREIIARVESSANSAAQRVAHQERQVCAHAGRT